MSESESTAVPSGQQAADLPVDVGDDAKADAAVAGDATDADAAAAAVAVVADKAFGAVGACGDAENCVATEDVADRVTSDVPNDADVVNAASGSPVSADPDGSRILRFSTCMTRSTNGRGYRENESKCLHKSIPRVEQGQGGKMSLFKSRPECWPNRLFVKLHKFYR
jgi:hypothetical protein